LFSASIGDKCPEGINIPLLLEWSVRAEHP